jgi:hypothetical protein
MSTKPVNPATPRGPLSSWVLARDGAATMPQVDPGDGMSDDLQLALYLCYELHYGDVPGMWADSEWDPQIIGFRRRLEDAFVTALRSMVSMPASSAPLRQLIPQLIQADDGPSISAHMEHLGTLDQMAEFITHRSAYQLKEADPHTFGIPHLRGRAKQILAHIQAGEYGADEPDRAMHSDLFAQTMRSFGLDDRPNAHLDTLPGTALMISNLVSMFGLNRAHRGCLVGHLAVFEMTSVAAMQRYGRGLRRMGASDDACRFYDVHVLADAEHEVMVVDMAEALVQDEPAMRDDIIFGALCVFATERLFAATLFARWGAYRQSSAA